MKTGSESLLIWPCYVFIGKTPRCALLLIYSFLNILSGKKKLLLFCVTFKHHYLQHRLLQMGCTDVALKNHSTDGTRLGCDIFYEQWENPLRAIICIATQRHSRADSTAVSRIPSSGIHPSYLDVKLRAS